MWHLTRLALRSRVVTLILALAVAGVSVIAFLGLKTELIPDISIPYTSVFTIYPQATPDVVASEVSAPIEKAIWDEWSGKGLKHVTSTSSVGVSLVMAEFEFGTDMTAVGKSLKEKIGELALPQAVLALTQMTNMISANPQIVPINMNIIPLMSFNLSGDIPPEQLKQIATLKIIPEITNTEGVLRVDTEGGDKDQVVISPDPAKMAQYGISMAQIAGLLGTEYTSLNDVKNTPLGTDNVKLSDVATVAKSPPPSSSISRIDGQPSVSISVTKTEDANTVETANAVNKKITELKKEIGNGVTIRTIFDQSDYISTNINQLKEKAIIGGILAVLVVFFFLWTVRASLITAISIPLSMFIGFLCMYLTKTTINLLTLSAMAVAVGRLIDDSIVIVEVIYRRMRKGENFKEAAIGGAKEIATPITAATLATVAIFIPLMFVGGIVGELFIPFALTVTFAMLASLLVALTLIPALSKWLVSSKKKPVTTVQDNWYQKIYVQALKWTLGHRITVVVIAVVILLGSVGLLGVTGTSFMSGEMSEPTISINISLPTTADVNITNTVTTQVETILSKNPAVRSYTSTIGTSTSMSGIMSASQGGGANTATITVYLQSDADLQQETEEINQACQGITSNGIITVGSGSDSEMGFSTTNLNLSIQGQNQEDIARVTAQLMEKLKDVDGIKDLKSDLTTVVPKLNIAINTVKVATSGLPMEQMAQLQQEFILLMNGGILPNKTVVLDNESYAINIKGITNNLNDAEQAKNLKIGFPQSVNLNDIADVAIIEIPSHVSHTDTVLSASIKGMVTAKDVGSVNQAVQKQIDALPEHPGVEIKAAGISEMMTETFSRMFIAILIAIVIVLVIVILIMRSIINPLIIMVSIPLAFIGSILALLITGHTLGVSAMMGLLMLVGIVLTNAIVLVTMVEQQRKSGLSIKDALIEGGKTRLRPIIMTALTTILAMIPMAIFVSSGAMLSAELAIVVIGGMVSSTFLTLFVIPAIYSLVRREKKQPVKN
jgi:HAE1 family hydrophobic/amphiphilic exporter-1